LADCVAFSDLASFDRRPPSLDRFRASPARIPRFSRPSRPGPARAAAGPAFGTGSSSLATTKERSQTFSTRHSGRGNPRFPGIPDFQIQCASVARIAISAEILIPTAVGRPGFLSGAGARGAPGRAQRACAPPLYRTFVDWWWHRPPQLFDVCNIFAVRSAATCSWVCGS
jgi:hypothetical protein